MYTPSSIIVSYGLAAIFTYLGISLIIDCRDEAYDEQRRFREASSQNQALKEQVDRLTVENDNLKAELEKLNSKTPTRDPNYGDFGQKSSENYDLDYLMIAMGASILNHHHPHQDHSDFHHHF
jgi:hypothetical protein